MCNTDINRPIGPLKPFGDWKSVHIKECGEKLVPLSRVQADFLVVEPEYFNKGIPGAVKECYVREGVLKLLANAAANLPPGYKFILYDSWRPVQVQKHIFNNYVAELKFQYPDLHFDKIVELAQKYVSLPSEDINKPSPHNTGGALDISLLDTAGTKLDMEAAFDVFVEEARTRFYEEKLEKGEKLTEKEWIYCKNRRLLFNIMTGAGFTNYPEEWWHFDYGNQFWGFSTNSNAIYGKIEP